MMMVIKYVHHIREEGLKEKTICGWVLVRWCTKVCKPIFQGFGAAKWKAHMACVCPKGAKNMKKESPSNTRSTSISLFAYLKEVIC